MIKVGKDAEAIGPKSRRTPGRLGVSKVVLTSVTVAAVLATCTGQASATSTTTGEISTGNLFLGTTRVEVGSRPNGSFGSDVDAPSGYHPRTNGADILGFRTNPTNCDWDDSACETISQGDFFTPGSPYEAWALQIGSDTAGWNTNSVTEIAGSFSSVAAGTPSGTWDATSDFNGIDVSHTYTIDDLGIDGVATLTNTTGAAINDVYYLRGVDPDNCQMETRADLCTDAPYPPGSKVDTTYETFNLVKSNGASGGYAAVQAYQTNDTSLILRANSANAKAFRRTGSFANSGDLKSIYDGLEPSYTSVVGEVELADDAMYVIDRIPSIGPGESVEVAFTYNLDPGEVPPQPQPTKTTTLSVNALPTSSRLRPGKYTRVVKSATTNGRITRVTVSCTLARPPAARGDVAYCAKTIRRSANNAVVLVKPTRPGVKVRVRIVAKESGAAPKAWTRTWMSRR